MLLYCAAFRHNIIHSVDVIHNTFISAIAVMEILRNTVIRLGLGAAGLCLAAHIWSWELPNFAINRMSV